MKRIGRNVPDVTHKRNLVMTSHPHLCVEKNSLRKISRIFWPIIPLIARSCSEVSDDFQEQGNIGTLRLYNEHVCDVKLQKLVQIVLATLWSVLLYIRQPQLCVWIYSIAAKRWQMGVRNDAVCNLIICFQ